MAVRATPRIERYINGFRRQTPVHMEHCCRARATSIFAPFAVAAQRDEHWACLPWYTRCNTAAKHSRGCSLSIDVSGAPGVVPPPLNAALLLWQSAARFGDRVAIVERGSTVDYTALRERAAVLGAALR